MISRWQRWDVDGWRNRSFAWPLYALGMILLLSVLLPCRADAAPHSVVLNWVASTDGGVVTVYRANGICSPSSVFASITTGVGIFTALFPQTAGNVPLGTSSVPFSTLNLGTAATNNFLIQPAATAAARTINIPDPLQATTTLPLVIANGTKALNTASVTTATCDAGVAATATGTLSTDAVDWSFNAAPTATNKYGAFLIVYAVPSANTVTFYTCNPSATTSTPTAMTVNWSVRRP